MPRDSSGLFINSFDVSFTIVGSSVPYRTQGTRASCVSVFSAYFRIFLKKMTTLVSSVSGCETDGSQEVSAFFAQNPATSMYRTASIVIPRSVPDLWARIWCFHFCLYLSFVSVVVLPSALPPSWCLSPAPLVFSNDPSPANYNRHTLPCVWLSRGDILFLSSFFNKICVSCFRVPHQTIPRRPSASDPDGRVAMVDAEEDMWVTHLAMRTVGAPESLSRRALCKAVHLSPSSIQSWARLGANISDAAATGAGCSPVPASQAHATCVSSTLARACFAVAEKQAMFSLLGKPRDLGIVGSKASGENGTGVAADFAAVELAESLSGLGKTALCSGVVGSQVQALKTAVRAVHIYPGEPSAWRCVGAALVSLFVMCRSPCLNSNPQIWDCC